MKQTDKCECSCHKDKRFNGFVCCSQCYKSHSQNTSNVATVRASEEGLVQVQDKNCGSQSPSSVPYTPLMKSIEINGKWYPLTKKEEYADLDLNGNFYPSYYLKNDVLSALNGLREDILNESIGIQRYKVLEYINKWFDIGENK